ncbi:MAG: rod shape-determining protein MreC [Actinobacteria bacterium]|nr:rod shape-determining protein MreC [Actinomycetota bacterium]
MAFRKRSHKNKILLALLVIISIGIATFQFRESGTVVFSSVHRFILLISSPIQIGITRITTPVGDFLSSIPELFSLREENLLLQKEIEVLRAENARLREQEIENEQLRKLLKSVEQTDFEVKLAYVIGRSPINWRAIVIIDVGANDGIQIGMPVISSAGLVGKVIEVSNKAAEVQLIIDQYSSISARDQSTRIVGLIEGNINRMINFNLIAKDQSIAKGDIVVTSGFGGVFPKGILIGEVEDVQDKPYLFYKQVSIKPFVNFSNIEEVLVITNAPEIKPEVEESQG